MHATLGESGGGNRVSTLSPIETDGPVTVVVARFEDLVARGLRGYLDDDPEIDVLADRVAHEHLDEALLAHEPRVAVVNFGSLASPAELHGIARRHPTTRM